MSRLDPNTADLLVRAKRLVALLENPQPGLMMWGQATQDAAVALRDKLLNLTEQPKVPA